MQTKLSVGRWGWQNALDFMFDWMVLINYPKWRLMRRKVLNKLFIFLLVDGEAVPLDS